MLHCFWVTQNELNTLDRSKYRIIFGVGSGYYQCFSNWRDFLSRDKRADSRICSAFQEGADSGARKSGRV